MVRRRLVHVPNRTSRIHALYREFFANCINEALKIYAQKPALKAARATENEARTINLVKRVIHNGSN